MQIKANWRTAGSTALILAAGLWVGLASPLSVTAASAQASSAASTPDKPMSLKKFTKPAKSKKSARAKSHDNAKLTKEANAKEENAAAKNASTMDSANDSGSNWSERNANANASMPLSNAVFAGAGATAAQADNLLKQMSGESAAPAKAVSPTAPAQPTAQVMPADQLNDLDKTIAVDHDKPALMLASASLDTSPASASTGSDSNPWDKTSLIGRIFIAFGGLLTLASAARMMIA